MDDWMRAYMETDDLNENYRLLRSELTRLRGRREDIEFFDTEAVGRDIRRLDERVDGHLLVFVANDFGRPRAYRPSSMDLAVQDEVRRAILQDKYDDTNEDLNEIRSEMLDRHPETHKVLVAEFDDGRIRYYLPEGSNETTNFLTVREMVGLVDYTTNSFQREGLSYTY